MYISKNGLNMFSNISNVLEFKTLMCILSHTSNDGICNMKQEDIANKINTHRQAVNKSIKSLSNKHILSVEKNGLKRIYHLNPDICMPNMDYKRLYNNYIKFISFEQEELKNE